ncbi:MAG: hypothetical protein D6772_04205, partial [Bacteroidetes bacterium]
MQKLITLFTSIILTTCLMAQTQVLSNAPYDKEWRQIDSLLEQQLPQSAKSAVLELQSRAAAAKHEAHLLKTTLYLAALQAQLEEEGHWAALRALEKRLAASSGPQRAVLASVLAKAYT